MRKFLVLFTFLLGVSPLMTTALADNSASSAKNLVVTFDYDDPVETLSLNYESNGRAFSVDEVRGCDLKITPSRLACRIGGKLVTIARYDASEIKVIEGEDYETDARRVRFEDGVSAQLASDDSGSSTGKAHVVLIVEFKN